MKLLGLNSLLPNRIDIKLEMKALIMQSEHTAEQVFCLLSGKLNSSLNRSLSVSTGPAPSSISRPVNNNRLRRSTVYSTAEPVSSTSTTSRRSLSAQARKPPEVEHVKATRSTLLKRAEATPLQVTPAKRLLAKTTSVTASGRPQSGLKTKSKPEALVPPTPSGGVRGVSQGDGKMMMSELSV